MRLENVEKKAATLSERIMKGEFIEASVTQTKKFRGRGSRETRSTWLVIDFVLTAQNSSRTANIALM
jgi:hypothetical protein